MEQIQLTEQIAMVNILLQYTFPLYIRFSNQGQTLDNYKLDIFSLKQVIRRDL